MFVGGGVYRRLEVEEEEADSLMLATTILSGTECHGTCINFYGPPEVDKSFFVTHAQLTINLK